jgi:hypothetical protein
MLKILMGKLIRLLTRDQEFVRLNYVVSAEPAWLSQVTALVFVYHFLSLSGTTRKKKFEENHSF